MKKIFAVCFWALAGLAGAQTMPPDIVTGENISLLVGEQIFQAAFDAGYYDGKIGSYYVYEDPYDPGLNFYFAVGCPEIYLAGNENDYDSRKLKFTFPFWVNENAGINDWFQQTMDITLYLVVDIKIEVLRSSVVTDPAPIRFQVKDGSVATDIIGSGAGDLDDNKKIVIRDIGNAFGVKFSDIDGTFSFQEGNTLVVLSDFAFQQAFADPSVVINNRTYKVKVDDPGLDTHVEPEYRQIHVGAAAELEIK